MAPTKIPTHDELVDKVTDLIPLLRSHAGWAEDNRRLHDEVIEALADAGVFKLRRPERFGGYNVDTDTLVDVGTVLGQGCGSTSWVASVYWIPTWMACQFPDQVQEEVFSTPDVRICGTLSPTGMAAPTDGGIVVNGKWGFISGAHHSQWQEIICILVPPDSDPYPVMALVPMSDLLVIDDWHTSGLKGTGSISTVAKDLFIPQERVLPLPTVLQGQNSTSSHADSAIYRAPLLPVASASAVGTILGMAKGASDAFFERLPDRKITYTGYESQREAPITHYQAAEATIKIDQAEFHARRLATLVDTKCVDGTEWKLEERARSRADVGQVVRLAKEAIDIFATASGGSSIYSGIPIQRITRDIQAVNLHALMHPNTNAELYGRVLCGLEPNTLYI
ncbi:acyl-CoA dehydrogenase family protein [Actinophytocola algeriensis]|uniref:Alkylation response protein AidB-like acyl-CoA dehydrogenase n=1 Tax=Actinophytocola algeriensis TaxID=1768010 RepID=A0A7W7Q951_9PSEU|nr:acyl-CoA dehydrogenase [Actinophytocola algeriensis]MBB4909350.1 alkylation response protein AidB-like acyl-CoA dehydrogenase [Actinophytocola algeriensis]MBE1475340.1 alkylation response protein AidB-like acyl-CoA dehydrogenase [Actinophytocola algeriensis]